MFASGVADTGIETLQGVHAHAHTWPKVANAVLNTKLGFAAIIVLAALGVVMFVIVDVIERRLIPWHVSHRSDLIVGTP